MGIAVPSEPKQMGADKGPAIRALTETEIESLEQALGKPVDRKYLDYWISQSIADAVTLARQPTARNCGTVCCKSSIRVEPG